MNLGWNKHRKSVDCDFPPPAHKPADRNSFEAQVLERAPGLFSESAVIENNRR